MNYPLHYEAKQKGLGKLQIDLEILNPIHKQWNEILNYLDSVTKRVSKSPAYATQI